MIYFLVNNDYQLIDARTHAKVMWDRGMAAALIEVPHSLRESDRARGFTSVQTLATPAGAHRWLGVWLRYFGAAKAVQRKIHPQRDDVLFVYTEYEILNHLVVRKFKQAGARVYLIEDGGVGTYLPFTLPGDKSLSPKEKIIAAMTRCIPGLASTRFHKVNGVVFPWLEDKQLDGVCLYRPLKIVRSMPVIVVRRASTAPVSPRRGRVVFLNERMYDHYQSDQVYLDGLDRILLNLQQGFDEVFFKFHPREQEPWRARILAMLSKYPAIQLIDSERPFELLAQDYQPEVIASYFSTALLNLDRSGIEPMFLYQLLPELAAQKIFVQLTALLTQWNYRFVADWEQATTGYLSGISTAASEARVTLFDVASSGRIDKISAPPGASA